MISLVKSSQAKEKIKEHKQFLKDKADFEDKFLRLMLELGLYNKFNKTYYLQITNKTNYGFSAKLYLEPGLSFTELQKNVGTIQENLQCIWIMRTKQFQEYATIKIVIQPLDETIPFENPKIKPWEMYLGLDFSLDVIKNNCNEYCMFLLSGATGAGKTRWLYCVILSWILSCKVNEIELYLCDPIKDGFSKFKWAKMCKYYATELEELLKVLKVLKIKLEKRRKVISPLRENGIATNIVEYNKTQKSKMTYCYLLIDEFSFLMPDKTDKKEEKEMKEEIIDLLKQFAKVGREMGIFIINGVQKTVRDELPSIIKSQSGVRISFRANDSISSEVIMGDSSAIGLMDRYAVYSFNGGEKNYLFSPMLTTTMLNDLLQPYIDRNYKKLDLDAIINAANQPPQAPPKSITKIEDKKPKKRKSNSQYQIINTKTNGDEYIDD